MAEGMMLKVDTEVLRGVSAEVSTSIDRMERAFQQIGERINRSSAYWEGEGEKAYVNSYQAKAEMIQTALRRFRENVTDLQTIAGVYEASEREVSDFAAALPVDVIE